MRLLLDAHVAFWAMMARGNLTEAVREAMENDEHDVLVSVATAWEIAIKVGLNKWPEAKELCSGFERHIEDAGSELLPIALSHVRAAGLMRVAHRDPFDRLLVAQSQLEGLTLVSADPNVQELSGNWIW